MTADGFQSLALAPDDIGATPCAEAREDLWFAQTPADVEAAKALCRPCPVRRLCLEGALERGEPWGVWGGELVERGVVVPRKRPRGRPPTRDRVQDGTQVPGQRSPHAGGAR